MKCLQCQLILVVLSIIMGTENPHYNITYNQIQMGNPMTLATKTREVALIDAWILMGRKRRFCNS